MQIRLRTYFAAAALVGVLGAAGPALSQTATQPPPPPAPAPATEGQSAGQSFSNAWSDLKSSADNAWQALEARHEGGCARGERRLAGDEGKRVNAVRRSDVQAIGFRQATSLMAFSAS